MSKAVLFSLCWLGEPWRIDRYTKWLSFNLGIQKELGFDEIILLDNASSFEDLRKLGGRIYSADTGELLEVISDLPIKIYRFTEFIARTGIWEYPYCWRGLEYIQKHIISPEVDKIICIDSDFYVLTHKMTDYIRNLNTGWVSFFNHKYGFPEAAIHILCKDNYNLALNFPIPSYTFYNNKHMEWLLPFTLIHKTGFKGDRYGEGGLPQLLDYDYYGQWSANCPDMLFDLASKTK